MTNRKRIGRHFKIMSRSLRSCIFNKYKRPPYILMYGKQIVRTYITKLNNERKLL